MKDTARSRMKLWRILQEGERGNGGYRKKQNEAMKDTARRRMKL